MSDRCEKCGQYTDYQGWSNYETWSVYLLLSNDQGSDEYASELVNEQEDVYSAGEALKDYIEGIYYENNEYGHELLQGYPLFSQLLVAALGSVDWTEVAKAYWDEKLHRHCLECGDRLDEDEEGDLCDDCQELANEKEDEPPFVDPVSDSQLF